MEITPVYSVWAHEDEEYRDPTEIEKPTKAQLAAFAAAEDAGVLSVKASKDERAEMEKHVQSQEEGEKANAKITGSDEWRAATVENYLLDARARLSMHDDEDNEYELPAGGRDALLVGIKQAEAVQGHMESGLSYDEASDAVTGGAK